MRKGFRTFCNGDDSTSTLDQQSSYVSNPNNDHNMSVSASNDVGTLEEMILKLELEEERARKANNNYTNNSIIGRRMSCVNNNRSDILMSARNAALNQYPRFSLDGKDAMYRSSFRNNIESESVQGRRSVCCGDLSKLRGRFYSEALPPTLAGESVVWCKPGVVAKLMGLEAVPVPVKRPRRNDKRDQRRLVTMDHRLEIIKDHDDREMVFKMRSSSASKCKTSHSRGYCVMKPTVEVESPTDHHIVGSGRAGGGWPTRRFL